MKLQVRHGDGELTVGSQKEFLQLYQSGIIGDADLVKRDGIDRWVPAGELPWIRGMAVDKKTDNRRLLWITVAVMIVGLVAAILLQRRAESYVEKTAPAEAAPAPKPAEPERDNRGPGGPVKFRAN